jgi:hypothetical protein
MAGRNQLLPFPQPVNGFGPVHANVIRGNDNTIAAAYNAMDTRLSGYTVDPRDFGAKFDGVADDWKPVQDSIAAADASGAGSIVTLPSATISTSAPWLFPAGARHGVRLIGAGTFRTLIVPTFTGTVIAGAAGISSYFSEISNLSIDFPAGAGANCKGVDFSQFVNATFSRVNVDTLSNAGGLTGFYARAVTGVVPSYCEFYNCRVSGFGTSGLGDRGWLFTGSGSPNAANANHIFGGHVDRCDYGYDYDVAVGNSAHGGVLETIYLASVKFGAGAYGNDIAVSYLEGTTAAYAMKCDPLALRNTLTVGTSDQLNAGGLSPSGNVDPSGPPDKTNTYKLDGVQWPADQTLGTYLPVVTFGGLSVGVTYTTQTGTWTRIGNRVFFDCYVLLLTKGTSVGAINVSLPPIAANTTANRYHVVPATPGNMAAVTGSVYGTISPSATAIAMQMQNNGVQTALTDTNATNGTNFIVSGHYDTAPY